MSKHLEALKSSLAQEENIIAWCNGSLKEDPWPGVLVLTSKRLVFHRKGFLSDTTRSINLDMVAGIEFSSGMAKGKIEVSASGTSMTFTAHDAEKYRALKAAFETR